MQARMEEFYNLGWRETQLIWARRNDFWNSGVIALHFYSSYYNGSLNRTKLFDATTNSRTSRASALYVKVSVRRKFAGEKLAKADLP
jgi:hypothetical protein